MKRAARAAAALCLAANAGAAAALTAAEVYALVSPSVWRVVTYDVDGLPLSQGSAVVVAAESLATNCHVLAKAKRVVVRHEKTSFDAKLELWDTSRDVCQLRAAGLSGRRCGSRRRRASSSARTCMRSALRADSS